MFAPLRIAASSSLDIATALGSFPAPARRAGSGSRTRSTASTRAARTPAPAAAAGLRRGLCRLSGAPPRSRPATPTSARVRAPSAFRDQHHRHLDARRPVHRACGIHTIEWKAFMLQVGQLHRGELRARAEDRRAAATSAERLQRVLLDPRAAPVHHAALGLLQGLRALSPRRHHPRRQRRQDVLAPRQRRPRRQARARQVADRARREVLLAERPRRRIRRHQPARRRQRERRGAGRAVARRRAEAPATLALYNRALLKAIYLRAVDHEVSRERRRATFRGAARASAERGGAVVRAGAGRIAVASAWCRVVRVLALAPLRPAVATRRAPGSRRPALRPARRGDGVLGRDRMARLGRARVRPLPGHQPRPRRIGPRPRSGTSSSPTAARCPSNGAGGATRGRLGEEGRRLEIAKAALDLCGRLALTVTSKKRGIDLRLEIARRIAWYGQHSAARDMRTTSSCPRRPRAHLGARHGRRPSRPAPSHTRGWNVPRAICCGGAMEVFARKGDVTLYLSDFTLADGRQRRASSMQRDNVPARRARMGP